MYIYIHINIEDLLTIRADREMYYYGVDHLFKNHPDIVHTLAAEDYVVLCVLYYIILCYIIL